MESQVLKASGEIEHGLGDHLVLGAIDLLAAK